MDSLPFENEGPIFISAGCRVVSPESIHPINVSEAKSPILKAVC